MRLTGGLQLVLFLALTSRAAGLSIPLEVEQPPTIITQTSGPVIGLPFDNFITIRCEARANPPPQYRWTKDGEDFTPPYITTNNTGGTFVLHFKQLTQFQGKYRCYAFNKLGTAITEEIELMVPNIPKFPKEEIDPVVVKEGEPILLKCNPPQGMGQRQIYWMTIDLQHIEQDDRVSMDVDGNLYFSNAFQKDSRKDYCCFVAFSIFRAIIQKSPMAVVVKSLKPDNKSANASNSIEAPPVRKAGLLLPSGVQTEKVLLKGRDLKLECIPEGFPTPTVKWIKMGEDLPVRTKFKNSGKMLSISAVEERDQGKYMCTAENSGGKVVHYFDVIVEEPPKWLTEPPQSQLTVIGADVHIKCSVSGKPLPDITWRRNGELFEDDPGSNRRVLDDTVVLHNAREEDSAVYQCEASNTHGSILANVNIMVTNVTPLILTRDYQEYEVILGDHIIMDCTVFSSPPATITWAKDYDPEAIKGERFLSLQNGALQIIRAEKDDSGEYVCAASNTEGESAVTALLDVKDPTKIVAPPQDAEIISGSTAQLTCQVEYDKTLRSTFHVVWIKDGEEILTSFEEKSRYFMDDGMLQIMNVNLSDQGIYTCIARTNLDEDNAAAHLTVLDVPDAPKNIELSEHKVPRNVTLSWTPGSDHNSSVTEFIVEYEESQWEPGRWRELQKVPGNQATAELALNGHLNYQFRVYAVNAVGPGPPSEPTERYKTPPAAPDRNPENIKIQGHLPHQMDITWEPLLPIEHNGPGLEYKVSYRKLGVEDTWKDHMEKRHSFVVRNTSTFVPYEIKIQSRNSHGWAPEPKVLTGYSGEDVPTAAPRDIAVEVINTTVLRVSWTPVPPATVRGHLGGYNVHWVRKHSLLNPNKIFDDRQSLSFTGKRSHAIVPGLKPFTEYRLIVSVFNKKGNGPNSDPVTFNTPEGVPEQVPILTASNAQKDSILLVWGPPPEANGILTGYLLQHHLINETTLEVVDSQETNITGADTTQWELHGLQEGSLYRFHLSACTRAGCGPPLAQESNTVTPEHLSLTPAVAPIQSSVEGQQRNSSTQGWVIGTMCAVALLTLVALMACFVRRNKGGKYAGTPPPRRRPDMFSMEKVKEKEDLHPDVESQGLNDDTFSEYSDSDEKPLKGSSLCSLNGNDTVGDSVSRDSLGDYAESEGEFNEDGSFIGEYSGRRHRGSVSEPSGPGPVTA
ncbi:neural cell adhesion molecule L1-like protein isoform X4 [Pleuronectes platessa]|uniref:neural cell adhesion molecule L1-like protein isoform X4 n=1 Tax=Pleuronectes platessa TaxID=8262 RepID=UPI00232A5BA1|nr:neural cell adhesion molecule L1-like protein isoform X4 [Pleuronectes platessa]